MNNSFIKKIDSVIETSNLKIQEYQKQKYDISHITGEKIIKKNPNSDEYKSELEQYTYKLLQIYNMIGRFELYIERCEKYKLYLFSLESKDDLEIKHNEFAFLKILQEEYINYIGSTINELKQRKKIENKHDELNLEIEKLNNRKNTIYKEFINSDMFIDLERVYTSDYLDFDIEKVINRIYPNLSVKKGKRK